MYTDNADGETEVRSFESSSASQSELRSGVQVIKKTNRHNLQVTCISLLNLFTLTTCNL